MACSTRGSVKRLFWRETIRLPTSRHFHGSRGTSGTRSRSAISRTSSAGIGRSAPGPRSPAGCKYPPDRRAASSSGDAGPPDATAERRGGGTGDAGQRPQLLAAALENHEIAGILAIGNVHVADLDLDEIEQHLDGPSG